MRFRSAKWKKKTFEVNLFPIRFLDRQPFTIAENLVGTIFLTSQKEKQVEYADNTPAAMILDLPTFLRLAGATDRFIIKRQGKHSQVAYPVTEKKITRDGQPYRRYTISFDAPFVQQLGAGWYYQKLFLVPEKRSAGKKGTGLLQTLFFPLCGAKPHPVGTSRQRTDTGN